MPGFFLSYDAYKNYFTYYDSTIWIVIILTAIFYIISTYCTHLTYYYEKAGRGTSYNNIELIFTYFFDVFYMKNNFRLYELGGAFLILFSNIYLYLLKASGRI